MVKSWIQDIRSMFVDSGMSLWQGISWAGAVLFGFLTVCYADMTVYAQYGLVFLDSLFDGKLFSFYENAAASGIAPEGAVYDIGFYIIYGIWDLPVWLLNKIIPIDPVGVGALLWYKLLIWGFFILCALEVKKLAFEIGLEKQMANSAGVLFLLLPTAFMPIVFACQSDIIPLFFMLFAIRRYFRQNYAVCLVSIAVAMLTKPFPIFLLALLVLLKEKNILKAIIGFGSGVSLNLLEKLAYSAGGGLCGNTF